MNIKFSHGNFLEDRGDGTARRQISRCEDGSGWNTLRIVSWGGGGYRRLTLSDAQTGVRHRPGLQLLQTSALVPARCEVITLCYVRVLTSLPQNEVHGVPKLLVQRLHK
jgi:hypothetical protein